jgi:DNA-binding MarR family transcriptional regulator
MNMVAMTGAERSDDGLDLEQFLCFSIYTVSHAFNQFYRPLLEEIGLTYPQYLCMVRLWSCDDLTVKELGKALFLESNTLTPLLQRIEGLGLISRTRDPQDERQVRVKLTEAGRALRARAAAVPACVTDTLDMPKARIEALQKEIDDVRDRLLVTARK